ncbi:cupin domain-containing protein [Halobacteria archaeon AArc-m2/3/4]|uniref:Cupin domain-containing protein n=1 Tax=Natronoglomus mannanivorans TaxID=2979990 RepID=A0ABT2QGE6_9EURY|nr:cupin domain-containing protein [Halobacteria archaeon AArc-m2/3/4]
MVTSDADAERAYDEDRFSTHALHSSDRAKVLFGYFEPGQFIPVHAPESDLVVRVESGRGLIRDGADERSVETGDVVVVPAGDSRGIHANEGERLEALLVVSPPPTDAEHAPVREGLRRGEFEPS